MACRVRRSETPPSSPSPDSTPPYELRIFPFELHAGDRLTDREGGEWEVTGRPAAYRQGKMVSVRLQKPGEPSVIDVQYWDAHERIRVGAIGMVPLPFPLLEPSQCRVSAWGWPGRPDPARLGPGLCRRYGHQSVWSIDDRGDGSGKDQQR
jgi:hypothetical protein